MEELPAVESQSEPVPSEAKQKREASSVSFPYTDLNDAIGIARAIWDNVGTSTADQAQLSAWAGHETVESGAFRTRMSAARVFGLITTGSKQVSLTALGRKVVDAEQAAAGRVESFLHVPLYARLFERYQGTPLPGTNVALEADLVDIGVAEKQKDRARQVFQRSAEQAGFFAQGKNRLVRPAFRQTEEERADQKRGGGGGGGEATSALDHPMVQLLVSSLPPTGTAWSKADRGKWIALANAAFDVVYKDEAATVSRPNVSAPQPELSRDDARD